MLSGAAGSVDLETDAKVIRPDFVRIEQAAQQRVLRTRDRVQRARAVEGISEGLRLHRVRAATPVLDGNAVRCVRRANNAAGDDLQPALADHPSNGRRDLRRDAVAVNVPPRASMAQEPALLLTAQALPQRMAVR